MTDLWRSIKAEFDRYRGDNDPYTLVGGRIYRSYAPERATMPYIVVSLLGGPILWMYGAKQLEQARLQIDVYDEIRHGAPARALKIFEGLVRILEHADLTMEDGSTHIITRREGLPREVIEEDVIHISGDWLCERQVAAKGV